MKFAIVKYERVLIQIKQTDYFLRKLLLIFMRKNRSNVQSFVDIQITNRENVDIRIVGIKMLLPM
jgi:hypothetical protein